MAVVFVPNGNFARTFYTPGGMTGKWLKGEALRVATVSKTLVGKDSGKLAKSIKTGKVTNIGSTNLQVMVTADARRRGTTYSYAYVHHEGSKPHIISAPPGGALHWGGARGPVVYSVSHPGTHGNKYLLRALHIVTGSYATVKGI